MDSSLDETMARCPLKHQMRVWIWERYIRKLQKAKIKYLTLLSPPLMDIKHLASIGYVTLVSGMYEGVATIIDKLRGPFSQVITEGKGRPEHISVGLLHNLLSQSSHDKDLLKLFPFDAINLDYPNYLSGSTDSEYLSKNHADIRAVIEEQKKHNCGQFVLFITTRSDKNNTNKSGMSASFG